MDKKIVKGELVLHSNHIYTRAGVPETTVWDTMALENPTNAVISAQDEEASVKKSKSQIDTLRASLPDGIILDVGCGYGRIAQYLLPQRSFEMYVGMDSSIQMLKLFRARYNAQKDEQTTPLTLIQSDIDLIPLIDASVDAVIVSAVFLHNHKSIVSKSIAEIYRVLKPSGKLIVHSSFPYLWSLTGIQGSLYTSYLGLIGKGLVNGPVRYYSRSEVSHLLARFSDYHIEPVGFGILPKKILIFPPALNSFYRIYIVKPFHQALEYLLPLSVQRWFPAHLDVIATK